MNDKGGDDREGRVLVQAPTARDALATRDILAAVGIASVVCPTIADVCREAAFGAGAIVLTAEAALADKAGQLRALLNAQPPWSDLPLIVLTPPGADSPALLRELEAIGLMTLMKRPVQVSTIVSMVRAALRDRARQYAVREHMEEEKRQAERLRAADARWRLTVESVGDYAIFTVDLNGRVVTWNPGAERVFGWPEAEILGQASEVLFTPEDRAAGVPATEQVTALETGRAEGERWHVRKDGVRFFASGVLTPLRDDQVMGYTKVCRDVTARRQAEQRERFLVTLADRTRSAADVESVMCAVVTSLAEHFRVGRCGYTEVDEDAGTATVRRDIHDGGPSLAGTYPLDSFGPDVINELRAGRTVAVTDTAVDARTRATAAAYAAIGCGAYVTVPLVKAGRLTATLNVMSDRPRDWDVAEVHLVREAADRAWQAVEAARAQARLAESERRLRTALAAARMVAWEWTPADGRLQTSENAVEVFGLSSEGGLTDIDQGLALLHPDDLAAYRAAFQRAIDNRAGYLISYRLVRPSDGQVVWIEERGQTVFDRPGGGVRLYGVAMDVTARRRAEEELARVTADSDRRRRLYETILSNTPDLAYVFDLDHRFTYANEVLLRMWGRTWDEAIGKNCLELGYEPWHAERHDREIEQVKTTKRPIRGEVPFTGAFGRRIYDYIFVPVLNPDGDVEAVAGTTRDVTERKQVEEAIRDADRKKDDFLALLAHELRNPLAPLRNGLQVLRLSPDRDVRDRARAMMDRQLTHMVRLIDDLLDVSRISRNKMDLRVARILLSDVLNNAVETARPAIEAAGHELRVDVPSEPVFLDADLTRLAQVFANLLTNSAKYTERGGRIALTARRDGEDAVVTVVDTGIGIPPEFLGDIFDMFSQVDRSIERSTGGLGIGLALVKGLVEMHGGSVAAASGGRGRGSEFTVRLPAVPLNAAPPAGQPVGTNSLAPAPSRRILVVDDNRDSAESMGEMLRLFGNEVALAHDGFEAVARAGEFRPRLILMDVGMPRLNGYEATRRIREQPWGKEIAIVALTGWGQGGDRARSKEAGCDGHLVKPVSLPDLQRVLGELG